MQVYVSKAFSEAVANCPKKDMKLFIDRVNTLKCMSKTEIITSDQVVSLFKDKDIVLYAYHIRDEVYALFAFNEKKDVVILDEVKLINDKIESFVYADELHIERQE